ncbi:DnaB-like helicase N-terminal domain-containing protein [Candidatus Clavichlamydia salmonicola]|uniref:DnaB-like helicase N-terminal domain-containing protein n=1 Tax=Candidatus Clavichlamydia salmonicola TaxID=469812 RepID=UPI0018911C41|nr:DnaB-like helicase N-terminal domain-containing protein [Candidatus Clavichlamydia salmonicola]
MNHEKTAVIAAYETELLVLGRALNDKQTHEHVVLSLKEEDFFDSDMRLLFNILERLHNQDKPAGILFVLESLKNIQDKHHLTASFLTGIAHNAIVDIDLRYYIDFLKQKTASRKFYFLMKNQFNHFNMTSENPFETKNRFEKVLFFNEKSI